MQAGLFCNTQNYSKQRGEKLNKLYELCQQYLDEELNNEQFIGAVAQLFGEYNNMDSADLEDFAVAMIELKKKDEK